jgi:hypothetical protein
MGPRTKSATRPVRRMVASIAAWVHRVAATPITTLITTLAISLAAHGHDAVTATDATSGPSTPSAAAPANALPAMPQSALHTNALWAPRVARYRVSVIEPRADHAIEADTPINTTANANTNTGTPHRTQDWTFVREPNRIGVSKGNVDELWQRAPNGSVSLQRVFHDVQRVVDYSAGELRSLGIDADWAALSNFSVPRIGGPTTTANANPNANADPSEVAWNADAQLPSRWTHALRRGATARYELIAWHATAPADWTLPGARSANYPHIDAADFGDMQYDPAVRKAEAFDVRAGWRGAHAH